jgi:hypothetical protein
MRWQRLRFVLTVLNLVLLVFLVSPLRPVIAQEAPGVLRGRALELVDDHGRVRAEIKVLPAEPNLKMPDGTIGYPETVLLRLVDSKGGPNVKLAATEDGSGLVLGGEDGYIQILSRGPRNLVKIVKKDGREQTLTVAERGK